MGKVQNNKDKCGCGKLAAFLEHRNFTVFITSVILLNAVVLGLETNQGLVKQYGAVLHLLDATALAIFVIEIALKLIAYRFLFFRNGWNIFDFAIVGISLMPAVGPLSVLRALRILRVLRLVSVVPQMRRVISAMLSAIPGMASVMAILLIIFYVCAVLATKLFYDIPDPEVAARFHSIGASMYTLFQIMTLEGWSAEVVQPVMQYHPHAWIFFIPFIIITSFAVLNLFIGIIVDAMNVIHEKEYNGPERRQSAVDMMVEVKALRKELAAIRKDLKK